MDYCEETAEALGEVAKGNGSGVTVLAADALTLNKKQMPP